MPNKPKSLEELAREVIDTQMGISPQEFDALINPGGPNNPAPIGANQPVAEPTPAPIAVAPTASAPALSAEQPKGEPNVLELIPEKFKDKDVQTSIGKMTRSYQELETELKRQQDELANMQKIVQSIASAPSPQPQVPRDTREPEIKDADFFEKPLETVARLADRIATEKIVRYSADQERARYINEFRSAHADFDIVRPEIVEILTARPDLDRDPRNLPVVYEMARQMKVKKLNDLKASLGLLPQAPASTPTPPTEAFNREAFKAELVAEIAEELKRRRAAQGIQGGTVPITPQDRVTPIPQPAPKSPDDILFAEMLTSGPNKLSLELEKV